MADYRGAEGDRVGVGDFALMLRLAVKICGIRRVALCIISLCASEDAVGAEMNQPRTGFTTVLSQVVWKLGVDAQGERLVTGFIALLDEADAVDDDLGLRLVKGALKCGVVGDIIELDPQASWIRIRIDSMRIHIIAPHTPPLEKNLTGGPANYLYIFYIMCI